jgi:hypothetical protein
MILRYKLLSQHPRVFQSMTGLRLPEFEELVQEVLPLHTQAYRHHLEAQRQQRRQPPRVRAVGGGPAFTLKARDQILLVIVWLRQYPTYEVLAYLFGVSDSSVSRLVERVLPLLEQSGRDTMRMPDPGKKHRRSLDALLQDTPQQDTPQQDTPQQDTPQQDTPQQAVLIDSFEQRVQRPRSGSGSESPERQKKDAFYSGKKKQHTLKSQIAVDEVSGQIVDVSQSMSGPTADLKLLEASGLLARLPVGVGALGDLAYLGIGALHPQGLAATPRRKPRGQERPPEDAAYNTAFARRRIPVEHSIGRLRRYGSLTQMDRHHRQKHCARVCAVAGLVNRQIAHRRLDLFN